jgi:hypothetical protein
MQHPWWATPQAHQAWISAYRNKTRLLPPKPAGGWMAIWLITALTVLIGHTEVKM